MTNSNYYYTTTSSTYDPTSLQPLLSSISQYIFLLLLILIYLLLLNNRNSFKNYRELLQMSINSILSGKAFGINHSNLDWSGATSSSSTSSLEGKKIRRRYKDTQQGREAWESGSKFFSSSIHTKVFSFSADVDEAFRIKDLYFPGLLNAAGNLCFLNATLQVNDPHSLQ